MLVSYLFLLWMHLFGFSVCWGCFCENMFWYLSIVSGAKFVLVPIFPVSIVAASGGNLFWFLFFQQLHHCIWRVVCFWFLFFQPLCCRIWREVCFGSYFSRAASGGKFVLVPIFPATTSLHLAGSMYLVPIFPVFMLPYLAGSLFWFLFFQHLL